MLARRVLGASLLLPLSVLFACSANETKATAEVTTAAAPSATQAPAAAAEEIEFDPNNPPAGWLRCHRNHCHHQDGRVASYAQVMQEMGATKIKGGDMPKSAPPAPPDVASIPMDADKSETGLVTRVQKKGTGTDHPGPESIVTVHYTGWTTDGKAFDSSVARGKPAQIPLNRVIPGWTEGMQLMVVGEERRFWIPEDIAYRGQPGKPAGTLVFDIELIAFRD